MNIKNFNYFLKIYIIGMQGNPFIAIGQNILEKNDLFKTANSF